MNFFNHNRKIIQARSGVLSCVPNKKQSSLSNKCKSPNFINLSGIDLGMSPQSKLPRILNAGQSYKRRLLTKRHKNYQKKFRNDFEDSKKLELKIQNVNSEHRCLKNSHFTFDKLWKIDDFKPKSLSPHLEKFKEKIKGKALSRRNIEPITLELKEPLVSHAGFSPFKFPPSKCIKSKSFLSSQTLDYILDF